MKNSSSYNKKNIENIFALMAVILIVIAWFAGKQLEMENIESSLKSCIPQADHYEEIGQTSYKAVTIDNEVIGFITLESSYGYGGPVVTAVGVDSMGNIIGISLVSSKETPSYLRKVLSNNYLENFLYKSYEDNYIIGDDVDIVSGASFTSKAILNGVHNGQYYVATKIIDKEMPPPNKQTLQFGAPEILLLILFAAGFIAQKKSFKYKKELRWGTMIAGLFVLGFYYNQPMSLSILNQMLMGYFPSWHTHIYWYLLLGGIFLIFTIEKKNPYCPWFCPFGAAQDCIGAIGGAKEKSPGRYKEFLKWLQRGVAFIAIVAALLLRNPGATSFEVFGTLFKLTGSNFQFAILGIILVASLFIKRPWCHYLCPLKPVLDHLKTVNNWIRNLWKEKKIKTIS